MTAPKMQKKRDDESPTKKKLILQAARSLGCERFTPAEIEQIRRRIIVARGPEGAPSAAYVASVLGEAGLRVILSTRADTEGHYEEEFHDLLHFSNFEEAEMCLMRLDELLRKFRSEGEQAAVERVLEIARLGRRRAEMISRNRRVEAPKRAEKEEMAHWFAIWLETPDVFFDWLEARKHAPDFEKRFGGAAEEV